MDGRIAMGRLIVNFHVRRRDALRQHPRRLVAVHVIHIDLLLGHVREVPADDARLLHAALPGDGGHPVDGIILRVRADDRVLDIAERGHGLDAQIAIALTAGKHVVAEHVVQGTVEKLAQLQRLLHFGLHSVQLPLRYRLAADVHFFRQFRLGHVPPQVPQKLQILSEAHGSLSSLSVLRRAA